MSETAEQSMSTDAVEIETVEVNSHEFGIPCEICDAVAEPIICEFCDTIACISCLVQHICVDELCSNCEAGNAICCCHICLNEFCNDCHHEHIDLEHTVGLDYCGICEHNGIETCCDDDRHLCSEEYCPCITRSQILERGYCEDCASLCVKEVLGGLCDGCLRSHVCKSCKKDVCDADSDLDTVSSVSSGSHDLSEELGGDEQQNENNSSGFNSCSDSVSLNSWGMSMAEITESENEGALDFETEPLPRLEADQLVEFKYLNSKGLMPDRDEFEGIYRCQVCEWEIANGYCNQCDIWYRHLSGIEDDHDEASNKITIDLTVESCAERRNNESRIVTSEKDTSVTNWLLNLKVRLQKMNENIARAMQFAALSGVETDDDLSQQMLSFASTDEEILDKLRAERFSYQISKQRNEEKLKELQGLCQELRDQLRGEDRFDEKSAAAQASKSAEQHDIGKLKEELEAYKTIVRVNEWRTNSLVQRDEWINQATTQRDKHRQSIAARNSESPLGRKGRKVDSAKSV
jgi:hypothetical protein